MVDSVISDSEYDWAEIRLRAYASFDELEALHKINLCLKQLATGTAGNGW